MQVCCDLKRIAIVFNFRLVEHIIPFAHTSSKDSRTVQSLAAEIKRGKQYHQDVE